jgi:hypothetical protein
MGAKDDVEQFSRPEETTADQFTSSVVANIRTWRQMDIDFQLEGQFATGRHDNDEAIGLSYEPLVDDATLIKVAKRESLKHVYLAGTKITDAGLKQLDGLHELRSLDISHSAITDQGLKELEGLKHCGNSMSRTQR